MNNINDNNQLGSTYILLDKISSFLPEINTISGMLFYTFILYALGVLVKCCFAKPFNYDDEEDKNINNKMDEDFKRRLEEKRKKKAEEAQKLLNKIQ